MQQGDEKKQYPVRVSLPDRKTIADRVSATKAVIPDISNIVAGFAENYRFHEPVEICQTHDAVDEIWPYPHAHKALATFDYDSSLRMIDLCNPRENCVFKCNGLVSASRDYLLRDAGYTLSMLDPETLQVVHTPVTDARISLWHDYSWTFPCFSGLHATHVVDPRSASPITLPAWRQLLGAQDESNMLIHGDLLYVRWNAAVYVAPFRDALMRGCEFEALRPAYQFMEPDNGEREFCNGPWCSDTLLVCSECCMGGRYNSTRGTDYWSVRTCTQPSDTIDVFFPFERICGAVSLVVGDHVYACRNTLEEKHIIDEVL